MKERRLLAGTTCIRRKADEGPNCDGLSHQSVDDLRQLQEPVTV